MIKSKLVNALFSIFALSNISFAMDDGFETVDAAYVPAAVQFLDPLIPADAVILDLKQRITGEAIEFYFSWKDEKTSGNSSAFSFYSGSCSGISLPKSLAEYNELVFNLIAQGGN